MKPTHNSMRALANELGLRLVVPPRFASLISKSGISLLLERLRVVETCRQQGRKVLEYLTHCCRASVAGLQPDSLVPQQAN